MNNNNILEAIEDIINRADYIADMLNDFHKSKPPASAIRYYQSYNGKYWQEVAKVMKKRRDELITEMVK